ncbi:hypothetical protein QPK31_22535 [Massilia sp. YIM B02769]|uniref:hypothetical protein n=1 Tax=unclassified Massilia TaxID=2609279 RepID=UPI0025B6DBD9|nr:MULTISPECIES: hypothetical protein [unclassified Massilia]MDN4060999.1 hypothetical protein [Massilia sp. YIM B02769]
MDDLPMSQEPGSEAPSEAQKAFIARGQAGFTEALESGEFYTSEEVMTGLDTMLAEFEQGQLP